MNTYIALLRGVNVSGQKKILMAELRDLLADVGLENVQTYIQSGNVIFESSEENIQNLELNIHNAIKNYFGFEVAVLVLTPTRLKQVFDDCPFPEEKKTNSYFTMLYDVPDNALVDEVSKLSYLNEEFVIMRNCIYFYSSIGYGRAKCNNIFFERKLKTTSTARNYKTMVKLMAMSTENEKGC